MGRPEAGANGVRVARPAAPSGRTLSRVAGLLVAVACALVAASSFPTIGRLLDVTPIRVTSRSSARAPGAAPLGERSEAVERDIARTLDRLEALPSDEPAELVLRRAATLRIEPDASSEVRAVLPPGASVGVLKAVPGWLLVATGAREGLVMGWLSSEDAGRP
jgi:hypothetical protein